MKKQILIAEEASDFLATLDPATHRRFTQATVILSEEGFLYAPYAEKVEGYLNLFAIRITQGNNVRFFYCYTDGDLVYVLTGYEKRTQKIPPRELKRALAVKRRLGL